jgi:ABC-type methionine transport system ATPase subunit
MTRKIFMTFPQEVLGEPLIYTLARDYNVVPNIQGATITDEMGMMAMILEGEPDEIDRAVAYLKSKGVIIESIEEVEPRSR